MMSRPAVLIVAPEVDDHAPTVLSECDRLGVDAAMIDLSKADGSAFLEWKAGPDLLVAEATIGDVDISRTHTIWWRRPKLPVVDHRLLDRRFRMHAFHQWDLAQRGIFASCQSRSVNDPAAERHAQTKAPQLIAAKAVGFRIPETVVTNSAARAEAFIKRLRNAGRACVFKTLYSGLYHSAETRGIYSVADHTDELSVAPLIFQERMRPGVDLRITVFGPFTFSTKVCTEHADILDWRIDPLHRYEPYKVDDQVITRLRSILTALGLVTGSFDLRLCEGELVFFEVNPSGQFLFMAKHGYPEITSTFCKFLATPQ